METITFEIAGNHDDPIGNPLPKHRKTMKQQWTPEAQRYHAYLEHVRACFLGEFMKDEYKATRAKYFTLAEREPLETGKLKCRMTLMIYWKNEAHGDPENVFGAIADAIFVQDKYLAPVVDFQLKPAGAGLVKARIDINAN